LVFGVCLGVLFLGFSVRFFGFFSGCFWAFLAHFFCVFWTFAGWLCNWLVFACFLAFIVCFSVILNFGLLVYFGLFSLFPLAAGQFLPPLFFLPAKAGSYFIDY
jgi:hypothetical protein